MQAQERFLRLEHNRRIAEGERRARLAEARTRPQPSLRVRTLLVAALHSIGL